MALDYSVLGGFGGGAGSMAVNTVGNLQGLQANQQQLDRVDRDRESSEREALARQSAAQLLKEGTPEQIADFGVKNPEIMKDFVAAANFKDQTAAASRVQYAKDVISGAKPPREALIERIEQVKINGGDPQGLIRTLGGSDEDIIAAAEKDLAVMAPDAYKSYRSTMPESDSVNLQYKDGVVFNPQTGAVTKTELYDEGLKLNPTVGAQQILEDGTIIQSTNSGPRVYNSSGDLVKGADAAAAVKEAQSYKVSNLREAAGEKKKAALEAEKELKAEVEAGVVTAKAAASASVDAFNKLKTIESGIANIDEAIQLIDEGAGTGAVTSKLPSVRAASVKLDNLQGRLGLDVIGNTTFGALSESELKFALDTALPKKLDGPELKKWLMEKKAAQEKLADYLEGAAIYLGTPGNTHAGFLKKQKMKSRQPDPQQDVQAGGEQGGTEHAEGTVIRNPQTGETLILKGGKWVANNG